MVRPDPRSGFCPNTRTFYSLRPPVPLPPGNTPLSAAAYALSLQSTFPRPESPALIQSSTGQRISHLQFRRYVKTLASSLRTQLHLCKGDVAFVLSPNSVRVPILYFALLSIGTAVSPANQLSTSSEISRQVKISKPVVAFATSATAGKLPKQIRKTILIDSAEFEHMMTAGEFSEAEAGVSVSQDDIAGILYSSGTTGQVKGVAITHRNFIAITAEYYHQRQERSSPAVWLYTMPYFHVFGFFYSLKSVAIAEAVVVMERFELEKMLGAVEKFKVTDLVVVPPIVVAMVEKSKLTKNYDLGSLVSVACGAAPLTMDLMEAFSKIFPGIFLYQGYGMSETSGAAFRAIGPEEYRRWGSVGKLLSNCEAKIVDMVTGNGQGPGKPGELWIRGPTVMKGYVDNVEANSEALVEGEGEGEGRWLRSGDVCCIDDEGFMFVVGRVKEMIKYKGYQVAPAELEQLLLSHPDIADAAVIPYPDKEAGELPLAFVVRRPNTNLNQRLVMDFIGRQVAPYKKIRRVEFINSIPKNPTGKILRRQLHNLTSSLSKL